MSSADLSIPVKFQGKSISVRTLISFCSSSSSELQQFLERSHGNTSQSSPHSPHQSGLTVTPLGAAWSPQRFQNSASQFHVIFSGSSFLTGVQAGLFCICSQSEKKNQKQNPKPNRFWSFESDLFVFQKSSITVVQKPHPILWNKQMA